MFLLVCVLGGGTLMIKPKILVVDDDTVSLLFYENTLSPHFNVLTAFNAHQALEYINTEKSIAVVLSDYMMPELNGVELLKIVRTKLPSTMRILITGYADLNVAIQAVNVGNVCKFLIKPCEKELLLSAVNDAAKMYNKILVSSEQNCNLIEPLTDREIEVLVLLYRGLTNKEISESMGVSLGTVKTHVNNILGKLSVSSRIKAVVKAKSIGIL